MRLKIEIPPTWAQMDNPDGPASFCREDGVGAFQVSWAEYKGGKLPHDVSADSLKDMAEKFGRSSGFGELVESYNGACRFGQFGTGIFRSGEHPRIQIWYVSDGLNFIMATHICDENPQESEVAEAQQIASSLALGPEHPPKPKWKFW